MEQNTIGREQRIREAAERLFCQHGYEGTSVKAIADAAEVNKALVFYYYQSKEELFRTILTGYYTAHAEALLEQSMAAVGSPRERLGLLLERYLDFIEENSRYPRLVQQELTRENGQHDSIRKNLVALFEVVEQALGDIVPKAGPLAARHFFISFSGMIINYFTYRPVVEKMWEDPHGAAGLKERRAHIMWVVNALLDGLTAEGR